VEVTSVFRVGSRWLLAVALVAAAMRSGWAADGLRPLADPLAQAVIDSLAFPPRNTVAELLDAAIRATDVDALDVAGRYFYRLAELLEKAGDDRLDLLADLGDTTDPASLRRLDRILGDHQEDVRPIVQAIGDASRLRRRDPPRLKQAAADLASGSPASRRVAFDRLSRVGVDALPELVDVLQADATTDARARSLARELIRNLGPEARQPLLAWLGSDDVDHWPGVIEALAATDTAADPIDFTDFLLAPALVPDVPPAARDRAINLLKRVADQQTPPGVVPTESVPPTASHAIALLTRRLDRVLSTDGLPTPDHLFVEPVTDPATAMAGSGKTVERYVLNPEAGRLQRLDLSPRVARGQQAIHLARDLAALGATAPDAVRLMLLARLEGMFAIAGDQSTAIDRIAPDQLQAAITGPDGFDYDAAADVLELAACRDMLAAAAGTARAIAAAHAAPAAAEPQSELSPLPVPVRKALLRAITVPDATLQFEAARALALGGGDPPYPGSSRVIEMLLQAATSTGEEIVVVTHPDAVARESLATGLSRFGYRVEKVATGREAIFATRANVDTVLVVVAARSVLPSAIETVQFIQRQPVGDVPPVLVVVDPLDDDPRGKFLTQLLLKFADLESVGLIDRLESLFLPQVDPATGKVLGSPRFADHLAQVAGPEAVDPAARQARALQRRTRAAAALELLADLGRRGWDLAAAETTARLALRQSPQPGRPTDLFAPAAALLGAIGNSPAQQSLLRETQRADLPEESRKAALAGFTKSVRRYGVLLECSPLRAAYASYNQLDPAADRTLAGAVIDVIELSRRKDCPVSTDAAHPWPLR